VSCTLESTLYNVGGTRRRLAFLNYATRALRLETRPESRKRLSLDLCGLVMTRFNPLMASSVRMALDGSSSATGRPPKWFERASDFHFVDYTTDGDDTLLVIELPTLGEACEDLYRQAEIWDTRPAPEQTAFEVLAKVVSEVAAECGESSWFDRALLRRFGSLRSLFDGELRAVRIPFLASPAVITSGVIAAAANLVSLTPPSRQVRIVGKLDMIRHSTRSFGLTMDSGEEIHGVLKSEDSIHELREFFGQRVLALGQAVYRPSGRLLRIDAVEVEPAVNAPLLWSKVPPPQAAKPAKSRDRLGTGPRHGVAAFFGTWPGEESGAELAAAVRNLRA
jgi:hypothetical protein